jgi:SAM-dependent methyltransferase
MEAYSRSVKIVRERSYQQLVDAVQKYVSAGRWLDIGCSFGWLLDYARLRGFDPYGVEPSSNAAHTALDKGIPITIGEYPRTSPINPPYDVISFMDVIEHLPDPSFVLKSVRGHLAPNGALVVQLPDRECLMYRTALWMCKLSGGHLAGPLKRLYLAGLDFPHAYYFSRSSLQSLLAGNGFSIVHEYRAPTGTWDTMVDRVAYLEHPAGAEGIARVMAWGAGVLQVLDNVLGHGGLLVVISQ